MGKRKNNRMTEGKERIIKGLIEEYDIQSGKDIENALKDLLGGTVENILKSELDNELGYDEYERNDSNNARCLQKQNIKWNDKYPNSMKSWKENWDILSVCFKFSQDVRKVIYN